MNDLLCGYDMAVAISQNEINSQFSRLFTSGYISNKISANGLTKGNPFGGKQLVLSSYIRGNIGAPQVILAPSDNHQEVNFYFSFATQSVTPEALQVTEQDFTNAFTKSPDGKNALLVVSEDIPYVDANGKAQVLTNQPVNYWLQRTAVKVGTRSSYTYSLVPAICYKEDGSPVMIMLDKLQLSFMVLLAHLPTTAEDIGKAVKEGYMPTEVLKSITDNHFNEDAFSINQLFLNFDMVDFTQWNLIDPAGGLGNQVTVFQINPDGTYTIGTATLKELKENDPDFSTSFSTNLQYAFGEGDKNTAGKTPYIIGIVANSTNPNVTNPDLSSDLVATYIGYSATPNPTKAGLASLNYQVLCDEDPSHRIPKNNDGTVIDLTTNFITDNNFSGALLFSGDKFFFHRVLGPLQTSMNTGSNWSTSSNTSESHYTNSQTIVDGIKGGFAGTGVHQIVTQKDDNHYTIEVAGANILINANFQRTITVECIDRAAGTDTPWKSTNSKTGSLNWSTVLTMAITTDQELVFKLADPVSNPTMGDIQSQIGKVTAFLNEVLSSLSDSYLNNDDKYFNLIGPGLTAEADNLNINLTKGTQNNFISPTGKTFFLNNPRFNECMDLLMDITYEV